MMNHIIIQMCALIFIFLRITFIIKLVWYLDQSFHRTYFFMAIFVTENQIKTWFYSEDISSIFDILAKFA